MMSERTPGSTAERPLPSDAELKILRDLWLHGESTVREIHGRVSDNWAVGYTTVLKMLQRMLEKSLVERREEGRAHRYRATVSESRTQRRMARDLVEKAFGGSLGDFVQAALPRGGSRTEELDAIRRLLEEVGE